MSILDRKPAKYSTSDLFWAPSPAPGSGINGDVTPIRLTADDVQFAQDVIFDTNGSIRTRAGLNGITIFTAATTGVNYLNAVNIIPSSATGNSSPTFGVGFINNSNNQVNFFANNTLPVTSITPQTTGSLLFKPPSYLSTGSTNLFGLNNSTAPFSPLMDICNLHDNSGAIICVNGLSNVTAGANYILSNSYIWHGNLGTNITNTGTFSSTLGSTAVTGVGTAWTTALNNSYMFQSGGQGAYIGKVQNVTSTTTLVLDKGAQCTSAALTPGFYAGKPLGIKFYKGRITTTTSTATVVGSLTKFKSCNPSGYVGDILPGAGIFRYKDGAFVGTVQTVQNDTTLTLTASAGIAMSNEEYYIKLFPAVVETEFYALQGVEYFANRYWAAGPAKIDYQATLQVTLPLAGFHINTVFFSKQNDPECWDLEEVAGDFIVLPSPKGSDQIKAIKASRTGLLIFRSNDTYLLTGYSPETFVLRKLLDDGVLNSSTIKKYKNGLIWPAYNGIYYFDGTNVINILDGKLSSWYKKAIATSDRDSSGYSGLRPGTALVNDYFMLSWSAQNTTQDTLPSGAGTVRMGAYTMVLNMRNGTISFFTNMRVANSIDISGTTSFSTSDTATIILCHGHGFTKGTGTAKGIYGEKLFQDSTLNALNYDNQTLTDLTFSQVMPATGGPIPIIHSAGYTLGDATRLKFWKMFVVEYLSNIAMTMAYYGQPADTAIWPPSDTGTVALVGLPANVSNNVLKRIKFLLRSPVISFRLYPTASASAATSQRFKLFWWKVGGKAMRQGRV